MQEVAWHDAIICQLQVSYTVTPPTVCRLKSTAQSMISAVRCFLKIDSGREGKREKRRELPAVDGVSESLQKPSGYEWPL